MTNFDIELSGTGEVQRELESLRDDYASEPVYVVGDSTEYGIYLEFGTRDMPPYPWFRPAIRELKANPKQFIVRNSNFNNFGEIESTKQLVEATAFALEAQMKKNVTAQGSVSRSPGTKPDHPKVQTGNLRDSISAVRIQ